MNPRACPQCGATAQRSDPLLPLVACLACGWKAPTRELGDVVRVQCACGASLRNGDGIVDDASAIAFLHAHVPHGRAWTLTHEGDVARFDESGNASRLDVVDDRRELEELAALCGAETWADVLVWVLALAFTCPACGCKSVRDGVCRSCGSSKRREYPPALHALMPGTMAIIERGDAPLARILLDRELGREDDDG